MNSDNSIGFEGVNYISNALKVNSTLQTLYMQGCKMEDSGAVVLADALKKNKAISTLWLDGESFLSQKAEEARTWFKSFCVCVLDKGIQEKSSSSLRSVVKGKLGFKLCLNGKNWEIL